MGKLSVNTCGVHVRLPSDHLSQIGLMEQKDQTNHSVWVGLTNSVKITLHKQNSIFLSECNAILVKVKSLQQKSNASIAGLGKVEYLMAMPQIIFITLWHLRKISLWPSHNAGSIQNESSSCLPLSTGNLSSDGEKKLMTFGARRHRNYW